MFYSSPHTYFVFSKLALSSISSVFTFYPGVQLCMRSVAQII